MIGSQMETKCPDNQCILSNTFCNKTEISDSICQDYNNNQFCDFDGGDCCLLNKGNECCFCTCKLKWYEQDYPIDRQPGISSTGF